MGTPELGLTCCFFSSEGAVKPICPAEAACTSDFLFLVEAVLFLGRRNYVSVAASSDFSSNSAG